MSRQELESEGKQEGIDRQELIKKFIEFFKSKNHKEIENASLVPEEDPTVLFTTAGMHPLVPYLLGQKHPLGKRLCNVQKCIRTTDIEEVGDAAHCTFFEMLGNWSLGDYFKKEVIEYSHEFLTEVLNIPQEELTITCFEGDPDNDIPKDTEAAGYWKELGIKDGQIEFLDKEENWWGSPGKTGPCGPDTEMFYKGFEIWNDVFMEYNKKDGSYEELEQKNIDTGMGVERVLAVMQGKDSVFETGVFWPLIEKVQELCGERYGQDEETTRAMRIIADHVRAAVFILAEKVRPSNEEQGYIARRLIRRAIRYGKQLDMNKGFISDIAGEVFDIYPDYEYLEKNKRFIMKELKDEAESFSETLKRGTKEFNKIVKKMDGDTIGGQEAFLLYQSFGFPLQMTEEMAEEKGLEVDVEGFEKAKQKHKEKSRSGKRFKSGLADQTKETKKLHTATHLLQAALRKVLGEHVEQRGSNIDEERLRFDFSYEESLTDQEIEKIENQVNEWISRELPVEREEMTPDEAKEQGAIGIFDKKYGDKVSVYTIYDPESDKEISKEICAGPHVDNVGELGEFEIYKEESSSKGVRRIKARLRERGDSDG